MIGLTNCKACKFEIPPVVQLKVFSEKDHGKTQPRPRLEEGEKEALEHFKRVIKICPNRGHIFQNKL